MPRPTDRVRFKKEAEARFPYTVDIEVLDRGLGQRLNAMHDWCRENGGDWAQHGYTIRMVGTMPRDFARFYFMDARKAEAFREGWFDGYAKEELVAELGAAFLCADLELQLEDRNDHAAYIGSWLEVLRNDKRAIFTAAAHAQRAVDYLHGLQAVAEDKAA